MCGYSTDSAAPAAIAASTAEPPARSASTPAAEASECGEATMPLGASVAGLPVCMGNTARSASRQPVQPRAREALQAPGFCRDLVQQLQALLCDASRKSC